MAGYIVVVLLLPLSVGKTLMRRTFFFVGDEAMTERFEDNREGLKRFWQKIATQDQTLLERVHNRSCEPKLVCIRAFQLIGKPRYIVFKSWWWNACANDTSIYMIRQWPRLRC